MTGHPLAPDGALVPVVTADLMRALAQARPGMCVYPEAARAAMHTGGPPPADMPLHSPAEAATLDGLLDAAEKSLAEFGTLLPLPEHVKAVQRAQFVAAAAVDAARDIPEAHVHVASLRAPWRPPWEPGWRWTVAVTGRDPVAGWAYTRTGAGWRARRRAGREEREARHTTQALASAGGRR